GDALRVARTESGPAVGVENLARARLVEYSPDLQTLAELPAATVQNSAASAELRRLALVARALSEVVEVLLARNLKPDGFERLFHNKAVGVQHSAFSLTSFELVSTACCTRAVLTCFFFKRSTLETRKS